MFDSLLNIIMICAQYGSMNLAIEEKFLDDLEVIVPDETPADGSDALETMLEAFDTPDAVKPLPSLKDAPETVRACLMVEVANRLCWYSRLKVWSQTSDAACKLVDFNYELDWCLRDQARVPDNRVCSAGREGQRAKRMWKVLRWMRLLKSRALWA